MSDQQIDLHFRYRVTDPTGFEEYLRIALPLTAEEPYVLEYSLSRTDDGTVLQHERYEDEAAIQKHLDVTAEAQLAWRQSTKLLEIRFVGPLSDAFREQNDGPVASWWSAYRRIDR